MQVRLSSASGISGAPRGVQKHSVVTSNSGGCAIWRTVVVLETPNPSDLYLIPAAFCPTLVELAASCTQAQHFNLVQTAAASDLR